MRITNHIRGKLCEALIDHAFGERQREMKSRESKLAQKIYDHFVMRPNIAKAFDRAEERFSELDNGFCRNICKRTKKVQVKADGMGRETLNLTHSVFWNNDHGSPTVYLKDVMLGEFEQFVQARDELQIEVDKAKAEIMATLKPIHVARKLEATWPEVMAIARPVLEECGMEPKAQPLVVATESLNATLGLPPELEAELETAD